MIDLQKLEEIKAFVLRKQREASDRIGDLFPHINPSYEKYELSESVGWTGGFYTGVNYLCYEMSRDPYFLKAAQLPLAKMEKQLDEKGTKLGHDIGFLYSLSHYADYVITGNEDSKAVAIKAAETLIKRFKTNGNYIQAWDIWGPAYACNETRMIIDCMYNLPLLFRAYELTDDKKFYDIALAHAQTARKYLIRKDYTTPHTFVFNEEGTAGVEKTHQGAADDSCWARGQGWAVTGFAMAYRFTGNAEFLDVAKNCARVFFEKTEEDLIPKWDLIFQGQADVALDTSAAGIVGNGLMEIYDATGDTFYKETAYKMLVNLYTKYSTKDDPNCEGLIKDATSHHPAGKGIRSCLIYGDYYFAELLSRFLGTSKGYW